MKIMKSLEKLIDTLGYRGSLRRTFLYPLYLYIKGFSILFAPKMFCIYSRTLFKQVLSDSQGNNVYSHWIRSFLLPAENGLANLDAPNPLPWMYIKAVHFIEYHLRKCPHRPTVYEFGSGTSTLFFQSLGTKVVSVETNEQWAHAVNSKLTNDEIGSCVVHVKPLENSNPGEYGSFWKEFNGKSFESYVHYFDKFDELADVVLVDGECRVKCLESAFKICKPNGLVVLDNSGRERYKFAVDKYKEENKWVELEGPTTYGQGNDSTIIFFV